MQPKLALIWKLPTKHINLVLARCSFQTYAFPKIWTYPHTKLLYFQVYACTLYNKEVLSYRCALPCVFSRSAVIEVKRCKNSSLSCTSGFLLRLLWTVAENWQKSTGHCHSTFLIALKSGAAGKRIVSFHAGSIKTVSPIMYTKLFPGLHVIHPTLTFPQSALNCCSRGQKP